jgi:DNA invertase Pin-like site-specific DNA recombinase
VRESPGPRPRESNKGRVLTAQRQAAQAIAMRQDGQKPEDIARELGISRASVFRVLKEAQEPKRQ